MSCLSTTEDKVIGILLKSVSQVSKKNLLILMSSSCSCSNGSLSSVFIYHCCRCTAMNWLTIIHQAMHCLLWFCSFVVWSAVTLCRHVREILSYGHLVALDNTTLRSGHKVCQLFWGTSTFFLYKTIEHLKLYRCLSKCHIKLLKLLDYIAPHLHRAVDYIVTIVFAWVIAWWLISSRICWCLHNTSCCWSAESVRICVRSAG